jgi:hypothetical protein
MAELSHNIKSYIRMLSESVSHYYDGSIRYENNYDASILNHNVFTKFLVIDIVGEKNFTIPSLFVRFVVNNFIEDGTRRFIRQMYKANNSCMSHRGLTTVLKWMYNNRGSTEGCVQHNINGSCYYSFGNILLDKDFNPLVIPCYEIEILEGRNWNVKNIVYKISNSLFSSDATGIDTAKKFIVSKMIPYLADLNTMPLCHTSATYMDYQHDVPIKIEIENLDRFVCSPTEPSVNFQAEANAILDALVEDILNTNA